MKTWAYKKLYRETLQRELSLGGSFGGKQRAIADDAAAGPSWRPRIEPRLTLGNRGCLSARLTLPHTGHSFVERLSLEAGRGYTDKELSLALRYRDGERTSVRVERVTGDSRTGERLAATFALRF